MHANEASWNVLGGDGVRIYYQEATPTELAALDDVIGRAVPQLQRRQGLQLCPSAVLYIHPDLASYQGATGAAWFQLAVTDRTECRIDMQRLPVVAQHGGLETTLRHELFHLAQPTDWERWRAEGEAQRFAGEQPHSLPLAGLTSVQLDRLLEAPPDQTTHLRAMATAFEWVSRGR